ncbi:MAG: ATP synthase F1 subunit gamma [Myxococcales bacterium]|nr:ATP synthase F1 subunit gamma [Myxococcales bacterium]
MPSLKTIRKRITSVKSTQKITRAMKMVAGARLNRAQQRTLALRPYAEKTSQILRTVAAEMIEQQTDEEYKADHKESALHPLLARRPEKKVLFIVLSSDRGLCGGFNANVSKMAEREWRARKEAGVEVVFATIGRKSREYLVRRGGDVVQDFQRIYDGLDLSKVAEVAGWLVPQFEKGEFDAIYLVYNEFFSAITQKPTLRPLLPIPPPEETAKDEARAKLIYEPNQQALLERLVPMYVEISIYRALLDSQAAEYGARMTAMDAATRNAKDMIGKLTLVYNRARQAAITKELMEIIGGAEALKD